MKTCLPMLVIPLLLVWSLLAKAQEPVVIAFDHDSPPFSFQQNGRAQGIYPNMVEAMFVKIGQPVDLRVYPWKRVLAGIDTAVAGAGGIYKTSERLKKYRYSSPIFLDPVLLFQRRDNMIVFENVDDLRDLKLGVINGWSYGDTFDRLRTDSFFTVEGARNDSTNLRKLMAKRIDGFLALEVAGHQLLVKEGLVEKIVSSNRPITTNKVYIAFNKESAEADLIPRLDEAFREIAADGTIAQILDRHIPVEFRHLILSPEQLRNTLLQ